MTSFLCKNCDYRFESEADCIKKSCPYCGRFKVGKELSADELIESCSD